MTREPPARVRGGMGRPCRACRRPATWTHGGALANGLVDDHLCDDHTYTSCPTCDTHCTCGWEIHDGDTPGEIPGQLDMFGETT